ncbi:hypothetical protein [Marinobacter sp. KMM 10035]|uniref:hypothetical protein n=1 Tax=Marinobacter sp. KMM 10035 TaxID=3134034 RepID=UPI003978EE31
MFSLVSSYKFDNSAFGAVYKGYTPGIITKMLNEAIEEINENQLGEVRATETSRSPCRRIMGSFGVLRGNQHSRIHH